MAHLAAYSALRAEGRAVAGMKASSSYRLTRTRPITHQNRWRREQHTRGLLVHRVRPSGMWSNDGMDSTTEAAQLHLQLLRYSNAAVACGKLRAFHLRDAKCAIARRSTRPRGLEALHIQSSLRTLERRVRSSTSRCSMRTPPCHAQLRLVEP